MDGCPVGRLAGRGRPPAAAAVGVVVLQLLSLLPVSATTEHVPIPDPPAVRPVVPPEYRGTQPPDHPGFRGNHVPLLQTAEIATFERSGAKVLDSREGFLLFEVPDGTSWQQIALFDQTTESGIPVIGFAFGDGSRPPSIAWPLSAEGARAHATPRDHVHNLGPPFHDYPCSYLYMYGGGSDAYIHLCATDVNNVRYVGSAAAAAMGIVVGLPILGWLGGVVVWLGIGLFQAGDGSINMYVPGSSASSHYGWTYYYDGPLYGWYYHNPSWSSWYRYATRQSTGVHYYEYLSYY